MKSIKQKVLEETRKKVTLTDKALSNTEYYLKALGIGIDLTLAKVCEEIEKLELRKQIYRAGFVPKSYHVLWEDVEKLLKKIKGNGT